MGLLPVCICQAAVALASPTPTKAHQVRECVLGGQAGSSPDRSPAAQSCGALGEPQEQGHMGALISRGKKYYGKYEPTAKST